MTQEHPELIRYLTGRQRDLQHIIEDYPQGGGTQRELDIIETLLEMVEGLDSPPDTEAEYVRARLALAEALDAAYPQQEEGQQTTLRDAMRDLRALVNEAGPIAYFDDYLDAVVAAALRHGRERPA